VPQARLYPNNQEDPIRAITGALMTYRFTAALAALALAHACRAPAADTPPVTFAYTGATLINGGSTPARPNMVILTRGAQIVAVQPAKGFHVDKDMQVIDVRGKYIIPGLINTHVHLATLAEPPVAHAYLRRELYSGVTTVRDMAGDTRLLAELQREAEFDEIASPDIFYAAVMAGPEFFADPRTHDAARGRTAGSVPWMQGITAQTDMPTAIAAARGTGATAIKIYADLPATLVATITAEAHRQHLLVWAHAAVFPARPSDVIGAGVDVVSHSCLLGYEISSPPVQSYQDKSPVDTDKLMRPNETMDALFADMKRRGTILDATLFTYEDSPTRVCPLGINTYLTREALQAGIEISAGTDDDPDWKHSDSELDTEVELLVHKVGMTPAQALRSATLVGARTVGMDQQIGTIEAGKEANFVVLERSPLEDIAAIRTVNLVVKHGIRYPRADYKPATEDDFKKPGT
jgi:imidazolonepropionase-like amidohydrolase